MKAQLSTGFLPYELEDKVILKGDPESSVYTIYDMRMVQTIREQKVYFEVQFMPKGTWTSAELIERRLE